MNILLPLLAALSLLAHDTHDYRLPPNYISNELDFVVCKRHIYKNFVVSKDGLDIVVYEKQEDKIIAVIGVFSSEWCDVYLHELEGWRDQ